MDNICNICGTTAEPSEHDCLSVLRAEWNALFLGPFLSAYHTEDELLQMRNKVQPLVKKFEKLTEVRRKRVREAEVAMETASRDAHQKKAEGQKLAQALIAKLEAE